MKFTNSQKQKLELYRQICIKWQQIEADLCRAEEELGLSETDQSEIKNILYAQYGLGRTSLDQLENNLTLWEKINGLVAKKKPVTLLEALNEPLKKKKKSKVVRKMIKTPLSNSVQYLGNI